MALFEMITLILIAYLFGSVSSAIITCNLLRLPDPRQSGSNNPGATNVLRIGGKKAAIITLLGDALKGVIPILIARYFNASDLTLSLTAFAAFLGHLYPIFFRFEGGKGVATFIGCTLALSPAAGISWLATWLMMAVIFRYSSLAALAACVLAPFYMWHFTSSTDFILSSSVMSLILIYRHRSNICKLMQGKEHKIGQKS